MLDLGKSGIGQSRRPAIFLGMRLAYLTPTAQETAATKLFNEGKHLERIGLRVTKLDVSRDTLRPGKHAISADTCAISRDRPNPVLPRKQCEMVGQ